MTLFSPASVLRDHMHLSRRREDKEKAHKGYLHSAETRCRYKLVSIYTIPKSPNPPQRIRLLSSLWPKHADPITFEYNYRGRISRLAPKTPPANGDKNDSLAEVKKPSNLCPIATRTAHNPPRSSKENAFSNIIKQPLIRVKECIEEQS